VQGKKPVSAFSPRDGGLFGQRQKSSPAAERAAKAALLRSRMSVDSPRTHSLGRGTFLRGMHPATPVCVLTFAVGSLFPLGRFSQVTKLMLVVSWCRRENHKGRAGCWGGSNTTAREPDSRGPSSTIRSWTAASLCISSIRQAGQHQTPALMWRVMWSRTCLHT
jgi:hypothetical protein